LVVLAGVDIVQEGISKADLEKTIGKPVETVPQIFDGTSYVGGYTELAEHFESSNAAYEITPEW